MSITFAALASLFLAAAPAAPPGAAGASPGDALGRLGGVYKHAFENALVQGKTYRSENILEVVPMDRDRAYVRFALQFFNGHECSISGVAHRKGMDLVYETKFDDAADTCRLTLRPSATGIAYFEDANGACRAETCGQRGDYGFADNPSLEFTFARRRDIHYLARIKASSEFKEALAADAHGGGGRSSP